MHIHITTFINEYPDPDSSIFTPTVTMSLLGGPASTPLALASTLLALANQLAVPQVDPNPDPNHSPNPIHI